MLRIIFGIWYFVLKHIQQNRPIRMAETSRTKSFEIEDGIVMLGARTIFHDTDKCIRVESNIELKNFSFIFLLFFFFRVYNLVYIGKNYKVFIWNGKFLFTNICEPQSELRKITHKLRWVYGLFLTKIFKHEMELIFEKKIFYPMTQVNSINSYDVWF